MIGQQVQNYAITSYLGEGGMGTVYRASDTMLGRDVALKMLNATLISQPQFLERFKKEARVLAQLLHPNIAVIYNFIGQDTHHFMVMEYVEGNNLDNLLKKYRALPYTLVVPFFIQVLEGLAHAHKKGIFHRDIKPSNLMVTPDGTVKLMDFGIAKIAGEQRLTQVNRVVGTIEYMAPELIEGKDPSIASDIYAAGATMYELLTGKVPFENGTDYSLMQDIMKKKPVPIEKMNSSIPATLSAIVMKALEKKPEHRYTDAKVFLQALITAFPALREVDLRLLQQPLQPVTEVIAQPKKKAKATTIHAEGKRNIGRSLPLLQTIQQKILVKEKAPVLIGVFSLLVALAVFLAMGGKTVDDPASHQTIASLPGAVGEKEEKKEERGEKFATRLDTGSKSLASTPVVDLPLRKKEPVIDLPAEKKEEKKKLPPSKDGTKAPVNKNAVPAEEIKDIPPANVLPVKKEEQPITLVEEPAKKSSQSVRISTRLQVNLQLLQSINESTAAEGQLLTFSVTSPVSYSGDIIIPVGSRATGRIKNLTKKKISIVLNSVSGAGGQSIPFESTELSGRIEEIISSRYFTGTLRKGTLITF